MNRPDGLCCEPRRVTDATADAKSATDALDPALAPMP